MNLDVRNTVSYIDTWRECVDDLTQIVAIFRPFADFPPEYLSLHSLLPACATQLFSRLLDALRNENTQRD
jgi:hypothetical protein